MQLARAGLVAVVGLSMCLAGCNGGEEGIVFPEEVALEPAGSVEVMDCGDTPVFGELVAQPEVSRSRCWVADGIDAHGGPAHVLDAVTAGLADANPGARRGARECSLMTPKYLYATVACWAEVSLAEDADSSVQVSVFAQVSDEDRAMLIETQQANSELVDGDFEGVKSTAWVAVRWMEAGPPSVEISASSVA